MDYSLIIPVYNEERSIKELLNDLKFLSNSIEIIIINDGSNDDTKNILKNTTHIKVIENKNNLGKGKAIKIGLDIAKADNVILFDGDLEISINDIPSLIKKYESNYPNVISGSRWGNRTIPLNDINNIGNFLINRMFNFLYKSQIKDVLCCATIIKKDLLKTLNIKSNGFSIEVEVMSKLILINQKITEEDINYHRRSIKEGKKLKLYHGWTIIFVMIQVFVKNIFKDKYFLNKNILH
jgi:glycosyltransferase involved in cell wall biosynthesis